MFGLSLPDLPWNYIAMGLAALGLYLFGYRNARARDKMLNQKAQLKAEIKLRKTERKMRDVNKKYEGKIRGVNEKLKDAEKSNDYSSFVKHVNSLLNEIFETKRKPPTSS